MTRIAPRIEREGEAPMPIAFADPPIPMTPPPAAAPLARIEAEAMPAERLDAGDPVPIALPGAAGAGTASLLLGGASVLALGFAVLQAGDFVAEQFARSMLLGGLTLAVALGGFGLIGAGILRELRGLFGLRRVDRLRRAFSSGDVARSRAAARSWLASQPEGAALLPAIEAATDATDVAALLRAGPLAALRVRGDALARTAAVQSFVAAAAVPSPLFDGMLVGWRGLRLMRQVAALHGVRPGMFATLALLRRTALTAASVVTADVAVSTAIGAVTGHPLLRHAIGDVAGAGIAARRLLLLGRATATACAPIDADDLPARLP